MKPGDEKVPQMLPTVINLSEKFKLFNDHWSPRIIAQMNDYHFKLAKVEGEFVWHSHPKTDETFIVIAGSLTIEFKNGEIELQAGELCVVPKGVEHRPVAETECQILLIEPAGTVNTGNAGGDFTSSENEWL